LKWLDEFKRTLIEEDYTKMETLLEKLPEFDSTKEQKEALHLINEAKKVVKREKDTTLEKMKKIQKTKKFLHTKDSKYNFDMSF